MKFNSRFFTKKALGIFIDEYNLKAALMSKTGNNVQIEMLENFQLYEPIDSIESKAQSQLESDENQPFGIAFNKGENKKFDQVDVSESKTNLDVIINLLTRLCPRGTRISFNLSDSSTLYKKISGIQETKPAKIKQSIWMDYGNDKNVVKLDHIGYIKQSDHSYLACVHEDNLIFADLLFEASKLMHLRPPKIHRIESIEFVLAHETAKMISPEKNDTTAIVLFTQSYTKIIFLKGNIIQTILPSIHEGADSDSVCDITFSKLLFELDSGKITTLNNIVLFGQVDRAGADIFFKQKMSSVRILRFDAPRADLGKDVESFSKQTAAFGAAIAIAHKSLDDNILHPYEQNFLPKRIHDKVYVYRLGWHGILFLCILFASALGLTFQTVNKSNQIKQAQKASRDLTDQLTELTPVAVQLDSTKNRISQMEKNIFLIDSLQQQTTRWSPMLETFSKAYNQIGAFSLLNLSTPSADLLTAELRMANRKQVAQLERFIDKSMISYVFTEENNPDYVTVRIKCKVK